MSAWMNFIGKGYYTIPKFIEESRKHGITRRIALLPLMAMNWGDRVLCVQQEPKVEAFSAFVEFPITKLVGLTPEAIEAVSGLVTIKKVADAPEEPEVERECGSYSAGAIYTIEEMPLCDIAKLLKKLKDEGMDIGKPMIGCNSDDIDYIPEPYPRIKRLKQCRGFRAMNLEKFWEAINEEDRKMREGVYKKRKNPTVSGTFYTKHIINDETDGVIQVVENYQKSDLIVIESEEVIKKRKEKKTIRAVRKYEKQKEYIVKLEALQVRQEAALNKRLDALVKAQQRLSSAQLKRNAALQSIMETDTKIKFGRDVLVDLASN